MGGFVIRDHHLVTTLYRLDDLLPCPAEPVRGLSRAVPELHSASYCTFFLPNLCCFDPPALHKHQPRLLLPSICSGSHHAVEHGKPSICRCGIVQSSQGQRNTSSSAQDVRLHSSHALGNLSCVAERRQWDYCTLHRWTVSAQRTHVDVSPAVPLGHHLIGLRPERSPAMCESGASRYSSPKLVGPCSR